MSSGSDHQDLVKKIRGAGFVCRRCNACCTEKEPGSNLVLVSPGEVRAITAGTSLSFEEVAEPYPDTIREGDCEYTFAWVLRRKEGKCLFLVDNVCSIYEFRPWICRTYPFMLDRGRLIISPCTGIGTADRVTRDQAELIVSDLLARQKEEEEEEERIAAILPALRIPPGHLVVIDGEGMKVPGLPAERAE
jgi:Fe-S-cluster containining protein